MLSSKAAGTFSEEVDEVAEAARSRELRVAAEYNEQIAKGAAFDPYTNTLAEVDTAQYQRYLDTLNGVPSGTMARITIPKIAVDLPVRHGTTEKVLLQAIGHLFGTALPVGGKGGHAALIGHSGLADAVLFSNLHKLEKGDIFQIESYGQKVTYRVVRIATILPTDDDRVLAAVEGRDLVSLVTCTPIAINSHRLVVTGERIPNPPENPGALPVQDIPGFPWWLVWAGSGIAIIAAYAYVGLPARRHRIRPTSGAC